MRIETDIFVIGSGPAGMAAAIAARTHGRRVTVADDNPAPGGQIWRAVENDWTRRFHASGAQVLYQTRVVSSPEPGVYLAERGPEAIEIRAAKTVLATGARELFLPFEGWTLPHVAGAGGLQALAKGGLPVDGKRVVVAGSGPLLMAVAAYLKSRGAHIVCIAEQAPAASLARFTAFALSHPSKLWQAVGLGAQLAGVRLRTSCWPVKAEPGAVWLHGVGRVSCDYVACGYGLVPNTELAASLGAQLLNGAVVVDEWQQTSLPGIYTAGEPVGIAGVDAALVEGEIAGHAASEATTEARKRFPRRRVWSRFRQRLAAGFPLRPELRQAVAESTLVCRCEDVPLAAIARCQGWRDAKLQTRCGMGPCQGRVCGPAIEFLLGWRPESVRPPIFPARAGTLARGAD